jgi:hypothetical protein
MRADLADKFVLTIHPLALGSERRHLPYVPSDRGHS